LAVEDCVVESSKEISYLEYTTADGDVTKDEDVDTETFDLTTVDGIEDVETVEVKAGTTVQSFDVACAAGEETPDEGTTEGAGAEDGDDTERGDAGDTETGDETDTGDEVEAASISLNGCMVESTKDISNIEFFSGDTSWKDESMNSESFDLTTVEGIDEVDSITVKSSTTVEEFAVDCAFGGGTATESGDQDAEQDTTSTEGSGDDTETTADGSGDTDESGATAQETEASQDDDSAARESQTETEADTEDDESKEAEDTDSEEDAGDTAEDEDKENEKAEDQDDDDSEQAEDA
jgi:hypothetical protein